MGGTFNSLYIYCSRPLPLFAAQALALATQTTQHESSMAVGKFSDWPWKGTLMGFFLFFITYAACSYAIVFPILGATMSGAPSAAEAQKKFPEAYGFWLRGNSSFFAPGIMNRTDFNQSSPTYLHWTPPPGAPCVLTTAMRPTHLFAPSHHRVLLALQSGGTTASRARACPSARAPTFRTRSTPAS